MRKRGPLSVRSRSPEPGGLDGPDGPDDGESIRNRTPPEQATHGDA